MPNFSIPKELFPGQPPEEQINLAEKLVIFLLNKLLDEKLDLPSEDFPPTAPKQAHTTITLAVYLQYCLCQMIKDHINRRVAINNSINSSGPDSSIRVQFHFSGTELRNIFLQAFKIYPKELSNSGKDIVLALGTKEQHKEIKQAYDKTIPRKFTTYIVKNLENAIQKSTEKIVLRHTSNTVTMALDSPKDLQPLQDKFAGIDFEQPMRDLENVFISEFKGLGEVALKDLKITAQRPRKKQEKRPYDTLTDQHNILTNLATLFKDFISKAPSVTQQPTLIETDSIREAASHIIYHVQKNPSILSQNDWIDEMLKLKKKHQPIYAVLKEEIQKRCPEEYSKHHKTREAFFNENRRLLKQLEKLKSSQSKKVEDSSDTETETETEPKEWRLGFINT